MTEIEFFPYHNRHIVFKLRNGTELSGVLTDPRNQHATDRPETVYTFIATRNMVGWKKAERDGDEDRMRNLEGEIDLTEIIWAERLNY